ncbi:MAG: hypothetical protein ABS82_01230 [Rhodanobacter sp. SCN 67-45]|nr:MAG: hypothetical protein ABS82_01230 [Rhodanobacter sp. SCN 67-45]
MIGHILQFADLQELCQPGKKPRPATVESWAKKIGLRYTYDGAGGIVTTVDALNAALGLTGAANDKAYSPDDVL